MATKQPDPNALAWHPSLNKTFKGCDRWWAHSMVAHDELGAKLAKLQVELDAPGVFRGASSTLHLIAHAYTIQACILGGQDARDDLVRPLRWGIFFRCLDFRGEAGRSLPHPHQPLLPLWSSMKAAGPAMLSEWVLAETCARVLIDIAHKDMVVNRDHPQVRKEGWGKGTNDAFLIQLFSQAFGIETHYAPANPMIPEYRALLDHWRTSDEAQFRAVMQAACEFHIARSKDGTERNKYEFEKDIDRVYPAELLAIQALRRRDGLPAFESGHLLVDTPWKIVRDLPPCEPHPLAVAVEQRLKQDFPGFR